MGGGGVLRIREHLVDASRGPQSFRRKQCYPIKQHLADARRGLLCPARASGKQSRCCSFEADTLLFMGISPKCMWRMEGGSRGVPQDTYIPCEQIREKSSKT